MESFKEGKPLILFSLLPHEQKVIKYGPADTLRCAAPHRIPSAAWLGEVLAAEGLGWNLPRCKAGPSLWAEQADAAGVFGLECVCVVTSGQGCWSLLGRPVALCSITACRLCCQPLAALPLLQMSVLNFLVRRHPSNSEPVRAKEELIFHCGFRRFRAAPLFSQHTSGL